MKDENAELKTKRLQFINGLKNYYKDIAMFKGYDQWELIEHFKLDKDLEKIEEQIIEYSNVFNYQEARDITLNEIIVFIEENFEFEEDWHQEIVLKYFQKIAADEIIANVGFIDVVYLDFLRKFIWGNYKHGKEKECEYILKPLLNFVRMSNGYSKYCAKGLEEIYKNDKLGFLKCFDSLLVDLWY